MLDNERAELEGGGGKETGRAAKQPGVNWTLSFGERMGSSPTKHVDVKTDLSSAFADGSPAQPNGADSPSPATAESDEAGWIACPRCLQLLDDPRQSPGCRHPVCRGCYQPGAECPVCGEVGRQPPELLAPDEDAAR
uniref:RING-type domain-containing protein n=1 Tax=Macrostomum lignano TaxID=282301 RepID=A0A1I8GNK4_9PLAT